MPSSIETELRATVAMADEDLRIATKHRIEAAERPANGGPNEDAYKRALRWENHCREASQAAHGRLIRFSLGEEV